MMNDEEAYIARLTEDPGDECYADYADFLRVRKRFSEAVGVCLAGLSADPGYRRGRLILARVFYDAGFLPFAVREVEELQRQAPDNPALKRLLDVMLQDMSSVEGESGIVEGETTVAESAFDIDDIEN